MSLANAVTAGDVDELRRLLAAGLEPNEKDDAGNTALHLAAWTDNPAAAKTLLEHRGGCGASVFAASRLRHLRPQPIRSRGY